ncbi:MAG: hypothetical protein RBR33_08425, partial [Sulfurovaceae bacterium]|nr:hypothetical protein [Sulfurovaceae bacterium]
IKIINKTDRRDINRLRHTQKALIALKKAVLLRVTQKAVFLEAKVLHLQVADLLEAKPAHLQAADLLEVDFDKTSNY